MTKVDQQEKHSRYENGTVNLNPETKMFNNKFKFDAAADLAKSILEADTKAKMEALKGDQEKLDKNRNGKLDAQDFKILRGEKKVNEGEADYQSSYRVGKTANFKPKASDVGQGRKITGKMGKYGKQPDDDNMVEPPPEHKVGVVKTDPSAVVPGHSTMGAKLHLASLPRDSEGNPVVKGARRVNAADLVAKRKAMMAGQKNEEVESLDEISIKTKMKAYSATQDPDADQGYGDKVHDQGDRIRASIAKKHGETMAKHADAHASADHYGRKDASGKYKTHAILARDKLSKDSSSPQRVTKSGKLHAQDVKTLKNTIKSRNEEVESIEEGMEDTLHPAGAALLKHIKPEHHNLYKPHLTKDVFNGSFGDRHAVLKAANDAGHLKMALNKQNEEVEELDELSKSTLGSYVKKAIRDKSDVAYEKGYWDRADRKDKPEKRLVRDKISDRKSWRDAGIKKAINRLTKEDVESINEEDPYLGPYIGSKEERTELWTKHAHAAHNGDDHEEEKISRHAQNLYGKRFAHDMEQHSNHYVMKNKFSDSRAEERDHIHEMGKLAQRHQVDNQHLKHDHLVKESLEERTLTAGETAEKEKIVHGMKKSLKGFKARYGDRAKEVMYATATKQAKKD
jgi:hypothetical protein